jgi:hypothetical protein
MKMKRVAQVFAFTAFAAVTAMCGENEAEDAQEDVVEAQQEAAKVADERPGDTAAIREAGQEVIEEQREAATEMRQEMKDKGVDSAAIRTTTRE